MFLKIAYFALFIMFHIQHNIILLNFIHVFISQCIVDILLNKEIFFLPHYSC